MKPFRTIIAAVFLIATAQLLLKRGVTNFSFSSSDIAGVFTSLVSNPFVILGLVSLFFGTIIWLSVLSKAELSYAYPILSLGYIFVALASMFFLNEHLSLVRWLGISTICFGVFLMSRS